MCLKAMSKKLHLSQLCDLHQMVGVGVQPACSWWDFEFGCTCVIDGWDLEVEYVDTSLSGCISR